MKKISLVLILVILAGMLAACESAASTDGSSAAQGSDSSAATIAPQNSNFNLTGMPIVNETVTYRLFGARHELHIDWADMEIFQDMHARSNVDFIFDTPPNSGFLEKKNLTFASGDLPDVFYGASLSADEEAKYGAQGLLMPLENLIAEYAPNLSAILEARPDVRKTMTALDGHIYSLPYLEDADGPLPNTFFINQTWLDAIGAEMPTTIDELYEVLTRFKNEDPNGNGIADEIPLSSTTTAAQGSNTTALQDIQDLLLSAFGIMGTSASKNNPVENVFVEDGTVIYTPADPRFEEYLTYANKFYAEGLIDKDVFTQTNQEMIAKGNENRLGMTYGSVPYQTVGNEYDADFVVFEPLLTGNNRTQLWYRPNSVITGTFALSSTCPNPEIMIRWADYFYTYEAGMDAIFGTEGIGWEWINDDKSLFNRIIPADQNPEEFRATLTPNVGVYIPCYRAIELRKNREDSMMPFYTAKEEQILPLCVTLFPIVTYTEEEQKARTMLETDINAYMQQMHSKFILGTADIEKEWDSYLSTLNSMGLEDLIGIYQVAYDRWSAA